MMNGILHITGARSGRLCFAPSDTGAGTGTETLPGALQTAENDLNTASTIGAAIGGPIGIAVAGGLGVTEDVVNAILASSAHKTALQDAVTGAQTLVSNAPALAAALAPANPAAAATVTAAATKATGFLADLEDLAKLFGIKW